MIWFAKYNRNGEYYVKEKNWETRERVSCEYPFDYAVGWFSYEMKPADIIPILRETLIKTMEDEVDKLQNRLKTLRGIS